MVDGLVGCVRRVVVDGRELDMRKMGEVVGDAVEGSNVGGWCCLLLWVLFDVVGVVCCC